MRVYDSPPAEEWGPDEAGVVWLPHYAFYLLKVTYLDQMLGDFTFEKRVGGNLEVPKTVVISSPRVLKETPSILEWYSHDLWKT